MNDRPHKQVTREEAVQLCTAWREQDLTVVFTNGVFDILHRGHVEYLAEARLLGDRLVVGVNDDDSAHRLGKGADRPLNSLDDRLTVLAGLASVDLLVPFHEDTPLDIIQLLRPGILVKGGDYTEDEVVGASDVRADGGEVVLVRLREGVSTTALLKKIRNSG
ncbi:D-glycero-beta-D-manno-heptose 1-phosphate adenylyltransferase [Candidatus Zixiibacteriota bacterium]